MTSLEQAILARVGRIHPGSTLCPGTLARDLGVSTDTLRPHLSELQQSQRITITQGGMARPLSEVRGPYRVGLARAPQSPELPAYAAWVGMDYSGAGEPDEPQTGIRVFRAHGNAVPEECFPQPGVGWSRAELYRWIRRAADAGVPILIGIDHALSLPAGYATRKRLHTWDGILRHARKNWPTDRMSVRAARDRVPFPPVSEGYRLCDRWTASAKSLFHFDVPGSVAGSTAGGLAWMDHLRRHCRDSVHFWPFDGWLPEAGKSVIAEVYPSLWRRRFDAPAQLNPDQRDAWTVAAWLQWASQSGHLSRYWTPPLSDAQKEQARLEGWILGVV
jgi:hypothetical protein